MLCGGMSWVPSLILLVILILNNVQCVTNSIDPDQTPQNAASDLGLNCLHIQTI